MFRVSTSVFSIIQFILLIDSTKHSKIKQGIMGLKAIGNTIKKPIIKTFGNTIKNSLSVLRRNKNTIKTLSSNKEKKYLITCKNFGNRSIKYLGEQGIKKYKRIVPQAFQESRKNIQMRSAAQVNGKAKGLIPVVKKSTVQIVGNELRSLVNMISKSKPYLPLLFAVGGIGSLYQMNFVASSNYNKARKYPRKKNSNFKKQVPKVYKENPEMDDEVALLKKYLAIENAKGKEEKIQKNNEQRTGEVKKTEPSKAISELDNSPEKPKAISEPDNSPEKPKAIWEPMNDSEQTEEIYEPDNTQAKTKEDLQASNIIFKGIKTMHVKDNLDIAVKKGQNKETLGDALRTQVIKDPVLKEIIDIEINKEIEENKQASINKWKETYKNDPDRVATEVKAMDEEFKGKLMNLNPKSKKTIIEEAHDPFGRTDEEFITEEKLSMEEQKSEVTKTDKAKDTDEQKAGDTETDEKKDFLQEFRKVDKEKNRNLNETFAETKKRRFEEFKAKNKQLTWEFNEENKRIHRNFEQINKKRQKKMKSKKKEFSLEKLQRQDEYLQIIKKRQGELREKKSKVAIEYHDLNKEHFDSVTKTNIEFVEKNKIYNKATREKHIGRVNDLVTAHRALKFDLNKLDKIRKNIIFGDYQKRCDQLNDAENREGQEVIEGRAEGELNHNDVLVKNKKIDKRYKQKNKELSQEFKKLNNEDRGNFFKTNIETVKKMNTIIIELTKLDAAPFREFLQENRKSVEKINSVIKKNRSLEESVAVR